MDHTTLDIAVVMDTTGSMGKWIEECKLKIKEIIEKVKKEFSKIQIRFAFIGYKDHCDKDNLD